MRIAIDDFGTGYSNLAYLQQLPVSVLKIDQSFVRNLSASATDQMLVRATIGMGFTILTAALLGFLGVGAAPPSPDWGLAVAEARQHLPEAWWFPTFPGLAILVSVLAINLMGDGLRDALDPKLKRS